VTAQPASAPMKHGASRAGLAAPLLVVAVAFCFQTGSALATRVISAVGLVDALWLRTAIAAIILVAVRPRSLRLPPKGRRRPIALLTLSLLAMNLSFYGAISHAPLGIVVAIEFLGPLAVAVMGLRRKLDFLWIGLALAGVVEGVVADDRLVHQGMDLDPVEGVGPGSQLLVVAAHVGRSPPPAAPFLLHELERQHGGRFLESESFRHEPPHLELVVDQRHLDQRVCIQQAAVIDEVFQVAHQLDNGFRLLWWRVNHLSCTVLQHGAGQFAKSSVVLFKGSLDSRIEAEGRVPELDVLDVGIKICSALTTALQHKLLHRDIKPGNILYNADGEPKLIDFGLAQVSNEIEQRGVDIHVLFQTLESTAPEEAEPLKEAFAKGYSETFAGAGDVLAREHEIGQRGRYL